MVRVGVSHGRIFTQYVQSFCFAFRTSGMSSVTVLPTLLKGRTQALSNFCCAASALQPGNQGIHSLNSPYHKRPGHYSAHARLATSRDSKITNTIWGPQEQIHYEPTVCWVIPLPKIRLMVHFYHDFNSTVELCNRNPVISETTLGGYSFIFSA